MHRIKKNLHRFLQSIRYRKLFLLKKRVESIDFLKKESVLTGGDDDDER